jgi:hypothetical protein
MFHAPREGGVMSRRQVSITIALWEDEDILLNKLDAARVDFLLA